MKKVQYKAHNGATQFKPVMTAEFQRLAMDGTTGFCLACGHDQEGCEPDTKKDVCESCEAPKVYGLEQLIIMNLIG